MLGGGGCIWDNGGEGDGKKILLMSAALETGAMRATKTDGRNDKELFVYNTW